MNIYMIFSAILAVCAVVAYSFYQLWQGGFAGRNYMKNEYDIDDENDKENNDNYLK